MDKRNVWVGGIVVVVGALVMIWAREMEQMPAAFPRFVSGLLIALGLVALSQPLVAILGGGRSRTAESSSPIAWNKELRLIPITLVAIIYTVFFKRVGYLLLTPPVIAFVAWYLGYRKINRLIVSSIGITAVLYILFAVLLRIPVPRVPFLGI